MRRMPMLRTGRLALTVLSALAISGSLAYAAIPDTSGSFTGCVLNNVGTIRLIDTSKSSLLGHCTSHETQVKWNARGPAGDAGAPGPPGPAGPKGDAGSGASPPLAAVVARGCSGIYDGSDASSAARPTDGRCDVQFKRDLTGCRSVIQPRPSIGYLTSETTMTSVAPGGRSASPSTTSRTTPSSCKGARAAAHSSPAGTWASSSCSSSVDADDR
jgi:hypothetical protein